MNSGSCPLYDNTALDDGLKAICSSKTLNAYNTTDLTSKGVSMEPVVVNVMAALASAIYCQLNVSSFDTVTDFRVAVTCDKDSDEFCVDGICGYIETNHCEKETTLKFTITYSGFDDIRITITQDIDISLSEQQDVSGYVLPACAAPKPNEPTVWVDFGKRKVFYKWEDSLGMNIDDLYTKLTENKLVLNAIAQDIIGTILAKIDEPVM